MGRVETKQRIEARDSVAAHPEGWGNDFMCEAPHPSLSCQLVSFVPSFFAAR